MSKICRILLCRNFFQVTALQMLLTYVNRKKRRPFAWTVPFYLKKNFNYVSSLPPGYPLGWKAPRVSAACRGWGRHWKDRAAPSSRR